MDIKEIFFCKSRKSIVKIYEIDVISSDDNINVYKSIINSVRFCNNFATPLKNSACWYLKSAKSTLTQKKPIG